LERCGLVQQRLRQAPRFPAVGLLPVLPEGTTSEAFGELLWYEMNNPLTGIVGNAELLVAEVGDSKDWRLSPRWRCVCVKRCGV
jgi:hypothetical protein